MTWRDCRLGDVLTLKRGHDLPADSRHDGDVPVVSSSGITGYHSEAKASAPGVVTGRYGTLGEVFYLDQDYWPLNTALYVVDFKGTYPKFAAYFLRNVLRNYQSDKAAVPGVDRNVLHEIKVRAPGPKTQMKIASTLSAYDDLMENNRRRMGLLEEAARLLYQEWFVRLRFPGHEHARLTHGIPEGWERKSLATLCESIDYGYTASADQEEVGPKFLRITDIVPNFIDWPAVPHCPIEDDRLEKFRLREGDIVIARTGATVGYAKRLHKRHPGAVFASYLVRLRLKPEADNLMVGVFVESEDYKSYVRSRVGGAAQPNANARVLAGAEILVPPPRIQRDFREFVEPLIDQREVLQWQNQKLRAARDLLLPRLMSGEIAV
jgi:type I restriction enzyme S subunit